MRVYLDSSAFLKLLVDEPESPAFAHFVRTPGHQTMSSVLLETECRRVARREGVEQSVVTTALSAVNLADAPRSIFAAAGLLEARHLRSLDALHLATALRYSVDLLVSYDARLSSAANDHGLPTASPS